jgi:hypothetical protein
MKLEIKEYASKYENYDIGQRLDDLKNIVEVQCLTGNYDVSEYMRGMANGLLLAWYIMREPYGKEVPYFEADNNPDGDGGPK